MQSRTLTAADLCAAIEGLGEQELQQRDRDGQKPFYFLKHMADDSEQNSRMLNVGRFLAATVRSDAAIADLLNEVATIRPIWTPVLLQQATEHNFTIARAGLLEKMGEKGAVTYTRQNSELQNQQKQNHRSRVL